MKKVPKPKQLTLDQISDKFKMSISEVNISINNSYNKIVSELVKHGYDMWDIIVELKNYFNITEKEAVEKLNVNNLYLLKRSADARSRN